MPLSRPLHPRTAAAAVSLVAAASTSRRRALLDHARDLAPSLDVDDYVVEAPLPDVPLG